VRGGLGFVSRDLIQERTRAGLAAARDAGRVGGRPTVMTPDKLTAARALIADRKTHAEAASAIGGIQHERPPLTPDDNGETWDVFVSHASEDKIAVAEPLATALRERGLKVWLDKTELRIGDSLRRKIDYGLAHSTFGIVILSKYFFAKGWPQYELDGIIGMSVDGTQRMLPIWHEISRDEIAQRSPSLVDKVARNTAINTIAEIADEISEVVQNDAA